MLFGSYVAFDREKNLFVLSLLRFSCRVNPTSPLVRCAFSTCTLLLPVHLPVLLRLRCVLLPELEWLIGCISDGSPKERYICNIPVDVLGPLFLFYLQMFVV